MFILKKGHQPGVYVPLRALFLVFVNMASFSFHRLIIKWEKWKLTTFSFSMGIFDYF